MSLSDRYARALRQTAPKVSVETVGAVGEGYWIDDERYFYLADCFDSSLGRLIAVPTVADASLHATREVVALESLAELLSRQRGEPVDLEALSRAEFDMPQRDVLGVSLLGRDYLIDLSRQRIVKDAAALSVPALYSPDGRAAGFVRDQDLWLRDRDTGHERALTTGGVPHKAHGLQTETCLAAVSYRKQPSPMGLWSPDSQWFLTHRLDERALSDLPLVQNVPPAGGRPVLHTYKYAVPGDPLPVATLLAIHIPSGRTVSFDAFPTPVLSASPFSSRTVWFGAGASAFLLRQDRYFRHAELIRLDLEQGTGRVLLAESATCGYLEFHQLLGMTPNVRTLRSGEVIWYSERDGWAHLYLYDGVTGVLKHRLTQGEWLVRDIVHVDEARRRVLFTACGIDPAQDPARRVLCSVDLDGRQFQILLRHDGDLAVARTEPCGLEQTRPFRPAYAQAGVSPDGQQAVIRRTQVQRGNAVEIRDLERAKGFELYSALPAPSARTLPFVAQAADGATRLFGTLFLPSDFDRSRRYPLIDYLYPGPQTNVHPQSFAAVSSAQAAVLAELGCLSLMLDTRGMPFRSKALHQTSHGGDLAEPQLADHAAVIRQLCERHAFIDPERIGVLGQSGGGFAAARAMFDYPELYKVGVAVCGNHDSCVFSALWSDKYRGPENRELFASHASAARAHQLRGKLLLISGDMDENVHVGHTLTLADALVRANRDFDLLIVPNEGHLLLMTNGYVQRRLWDYFVRHLLAEEPPAGFEVRYEPSEISRMLKSWVWEWRL